MNIFHSPKSLLQMKTYSSKNAFSFMVFLSLLLTAFAFFINSESALENIFFSNKIVFFTDFFDSIYDSMFKDPYTERMVIYPALTYLFYRFLGSMVPAGVLAGGSYSIRDSYFGQLLFQAYCFVIFIFLFYSIIRIMQSNNTETKIFAAVLVLSSPILYAYQRGNSILLSLVFLLMFFGYKDSEKGYQRELSLLYLAIAANIKLYPAVFGMLLVADKKYARALRCMIYGIILFVVPFFFFGGLKDIPEMFNNINKTSGIFSIQYGYQVGIKHFLACIAAITGKLSILNYSGITTLSVVTILFLTFFLSKKYFNKVLALGLFCNLIPSFNWLYATVYIIPAVLYYYKDRQSNNRNHIYPICFLFLFCQFPFDISRFLPVVKKPDLFYIMYNMTFSTALSNIALWLLVLTVFCETVYECVDWIFKESKLHTNKH